MKLLRKNKEFEFGLETTVARRLAVRMALVGAVFFVATFVILIPMRMGTARIKTTARAEALVSTIASLYQVLSHGEQIDKVSQLILAVAHVPSVASVGFLNSDGVVLYSTENKISDRLGSLPFWLFNSNKLVYVSHDVDDPRGRIASVLIAMDLSVIYSEYLIFYLELAIGLILAIVLLTFLVFWMTRSIVGRRLANLALAMGNAEHGSFLIRGQIDKMDEVGSVTLAFNKLLSAITNLQVKDIEREQDLISVKAQLSIKDQLEVTAKELNISNENLHRRVKAQELLMHAAHHLGGVLNKEALVDRLVSLIRDKLGWPDFAIFLTRESEQNNKELTLAAAAGLPDIDLIKDLSFAFGEGITGLVAETATPLAVNNLAEEKRIKLWSKLQTSDQVPEFLAHGSMLSVPMSYQGKVVGVMDFFYPNLNAFDEEDVTLLHALGALAAIAVVNADLYEATLELATLDPLTGILNRRSMERVVENEVARAQRFSTPLAVLLIDVDHFKNYNDQMGHVLGDAALKQIASGLKNVVRKVDSVARFGGEEFCVILPQTNSEAASEVAEKLCAAIRKSNIAGANKQPLGKMSVSIGIAVYPDHMPPILEKSPMLELVDAADEALYVAKKKGRDRIVCYHEINVKDQA